MKSTNTTGPIIEKDGRRYRKVTRRSALPLWAAAAVWLIAALLLPMYNMLHLIGIAIVSVAAALLAAKLAPKETILQELPFYEGNHDLNHVAGQIADARDTLRRARRAVLTDKPETAALLGEIEETCAKIQSAILASPEDLPKIRRFLNYYLPTTEKLANKYALIHSQKAEGENLSAASADIEKAMVTLRDSFQKQLDALFSDDALDISTDITVLETLLARDNLN